MIRVEELMIGDWVNIMVEGYDNPTQIKEIGPFWVKVTQDEKDYGIVLIEPIPITPEILERNGFESVKNIFGFKTYKLNDDFILEDRGKRKCLCRSCYTMQPYSTFWVCDIEHVNELQHALKLCGISKNIEL